jgi:arginase
MRFGLLGIPHDENSSFLRGPAQAPPLIRSELFSDGASSWSETGYDLAGAGRLVDHGDVQFEGHGDAWELIEQQVSRALEPGDPLICLGGDHAVTYPILRAVRRQHPRLTILHFDAHPDLYHAYQNNPRSHASPFARIMEERLADRLIQVGIRASNDHLREQSKRFGVEVIEADRCIDTLDLDLPPSTPVYISLDLDGFDPAYAPGVSHREPGGLSPRQLIRWLHALRCPIVGADVVEYNPCCDVGTITATVAAKLVKELGGMMLKNRPS